ncbi:MAG: HNH endonuclease [SAR202 cluster bacterium]|nr:HNH endonuclease [SAR202 cluster bacterium]
MRKLSAKSKIKTYFLEHLGEVVTIHKIQEISGIFDSPRRVREIRQEEGWAILSDKDTTTLKPGQYMLKELPPVAPDVKFSRKMSAKLKAVVLDRNGHTCQMCGLTPGQTDPDTGRKVLLHIAHIKDKSLGGKDEISNLRELCSTCNQGAKNITAEKPSKIWLLSQVRRAGQDEQRAVYEWLRGKFGE